jgi:hypothetical protein
MAAAPLVGHVLKTVPGGDRALHLDRRVFGRVSHAVFQHRGAAILEIVGNRPLGLHLAGAGHQASREGDQGDQEKGEVFHAAELREKF